MDITVENLAEIFKTFHSQGLRFEDMENPRHKFRDVCGMILLSEISTNNKILIEGASPDVIYFGGLKVKDILPSLTEDLIRDLVRCCVRYDSHFESFFMYI